MTLAKERFDLFPIGRWSGVLLLALVVHILSFAFATSIAQASPDAGTGVFLTVAGGRMYEGRRASPLSATGDEREVELGLLLPGGSVFMFELGLRGVMLPAGQGFVGRHIGQEIALFGGVRIQIFGPSPSIFGLVPLIRAGLSLEAVRDRITVVPAKRSETTADVANDRIALGPHFALGIERELWFGTSLGLYVESRALVAPVVASIGGALVLTTQALP
jgi:hypothetical protein